jgi:hypothetical protein
VSGGEDPYGLRKLRIDPNDPRLMPAAQAATPAKIRKRTERFTILPMWWYEKLKDPIATGMTCLVAWHLLHLDWKNRGKPFKLPNGMLEYDGVSRQSKWRALADLERRGLIVIQHRHGKSPIVQLLRAEKG